MNEKKPRKRSADWVSSEDIKNHKAKTQISKREGGPNKPNTKKKTKRKSPDTQKKNSGRERTSSK